MFCIGAAPTVPGMPDKFSMPQRSFLVAFSTSASQLSPASATTSSLSKTAPSISIFITRPSKPSSSIRTFDPPPPQKQEVVVLGPERNRGPLSTHQHFLRARKISQDRLYGMSYREPELH